MLRSTVLLAGLLFPAVLIAGGSVFVLPHMDQNQPWQKIPETSFGTLTQALDQLPDDHHLIQIDLPAALPPTHPVRRLLLDGRTQPPLAEDSQTVPTDSFDDPNNTGAQAFVADGIALLDSGRPAESLQPLRTAIGLLRVESGTLSTRLIMPWTALGVSLSQLGQYEEAADAFSQAQGLTQRHYGVHSPQQLPLLLAKAETWRARDEEWETGELLATYLKLVRQMGPVDSPEHVAATLRVGQAMTDFGQFRKALTLYRNLLNDLTTADGRATPLMAEIMLAMAQTFLLEGGSEVDRGKTLAVRAAALTEQFAAEHSTEQRLRRQLLAGDWLTLFGRSKEAAQHYRRAWTLALEADDSERWLKHLGEPQLIFAGPDVGLDEMGYQWVDRMAYVGFRFDLGADGRPRRVRVTESNLHKTSIRPALELIRKARFRPAILDGQPGVVQAMPFLRIYDTRPPEDFGTVRLGLE